MPLVGRMMLIWGREGIRQGAVAGTASSRNVKSAALRFRPLLRGGVRGKDKNHADLFFVVYDVPGITLSTLYTLPQSIFLVLI